MSGVASLWAVCPLGEISVHHPKPPPHSRSSVTKQKSHLRREIEDPSTELDMTSTKVDEGMEPAAHPSEPAPGPDPPPVAPPSVFHQAPLNRQPRPHNQGHNLQPVGLLNGQQLYSLTPSNTSNDRTKKHDNRRDGNQPYVKKPPNAFMVFVQELRPTAKAELGVVNSAVVNAELAKRWSSLSKKQQQKYYDQAKVEAQVHKTLYPDWSACDNYGNKRPRNRAPTVPNVTAPQPPTAMRTASTRPRETLPDVFQFLQPVAPAAPTNLCEMQPVTAGAGKHPTLVPVPGPEPETGPQAEPVPEAEPAAPVTLPQLDRSLSGGFSQVVNRGTAPQMLVHQPPQVAPPSVFHQAPLNRQPRPHDQGHNLQPVGFLNGQLLYSLTPAALPSNTSNDRTKKHDNRRDCNQPYVKKPPNAFMVFLQELRPTAKAELGVVNSAVVNAELAKRWSSLSKKQQQKYYDQAKVEAQVHKTLYPDWSACDNYGNKRPRNRAFTVPSVTAPQLPTAMRTASTRPRETRPDVFQFLQPVAPAAPTNLCEMQPVTAGAGKHPTLVPVPGPEPETGPQAEPVPETASTRPRETRPDVVQFLQPVAPTRNTDTEIIVID